MVLFKRKYRPRRRIRRPVRRPRRKLRYRRPVRPVNTERHSSVFLKPKVKYTHRYTDYAIAMNPGVAGTAATYVFSCNGLYDPNYTASGHQVLGFDQLTLLYKYYTVIGAKITATFHSVDSSKTHIVGISIRDSVTTETDFRVYIENGNCVYNFVTNTSDGGGSTLKTITQTFSTAKAHGSKNLLGEDTLQGIVSGNPARQFFFHLWCAPEDASDSTGIVVSQVTIEYITVWTGPLSLASS